MSILKFNARKFQLACGQWIVLVLAHTHVWHSRVILRAIQVTRTHACTQKIICGAVKSLRSAIQNAVGWVSRNRDFFSEASLHTPESFFFFCRSCSLLSTPLTLEWNSYASQPLKYLALFSTATRDEFPLNTSSIICPQSSYFYAVANTAILNIRPSFTLK